MSSSGSFVSELNLSSFATIVRRYESIVVGFFCSGVLPPRCLNCEEAARKHEEIARNCYGVVTFAKVVVPDSPSHQTYYGILGHPIIKIFRNHGRQVTECHGSMSDAKWIAECHEVPHFLDPIRFGVPHFLYPMRFGGVGEQHNMRMEIHFDEVCPKWQCGQEWLSVAGAVEILKRYYDVTFIQNYGCSSYVVRIFKEKECEFVETKTFNINALVKFAEEAISPIVTVYNQYPQLDATFFSSETKVVLFINPSHDDTFRSEYYNVAKQNKHISFMLVDSVADQDALWLFQLHKSEAPLIVIQNSMGETYVNADLEKADNIATWVEDYKDGKLREYGIIGQEDNDGLVKLVAAENFLKEVIKPRKNVFVLLGTWCRWCTRCRVLAQILERVAAEFKDEDDIVIAKLTYKNAIEIQSMYLDDYTEDQPTLCFKRAGKRDLYRYYGHATEDNIIQFIHNNVRSKLKLAAKLIGDEYQIVTDGIDKSDASAARWEIENEKELEYLRSLRPCRKEKKCFRYYKFPRMVLDPRFNVLLVIHGAYDPRRYSAFGEVADHFEKEADTKLVISFIGYHEIDDNFRKCLVEVMHHFKTYSAQDEPTIFFKTATGNLKVYDNEDGITKDNITRFIDENKITSTMELGGDIQVLM